MLMKILAIHLETWYALFSPNRIEQREHSVVLWGDSLLPSCAGQESIDFEIVAGQWMNTVQHWGQLLYFPLAVSTRRMMSPPPLEYPPVVEADLKLISVGKKALYGLWMEFEYQDPAKFPFFTSEPNEDLLYTID
jgi:hypothetical protein